MQIRKTMKIKNTLILVTLVLSSLSLKAQLRDFSKKIPTVSEVENDKAPMYQYEINKDDSHEGLIIYNWNDKVINDYKYNHKTMSELGYELVSESESKIIYMKCSKDIIIEIKHYDNIINVVLYKYTEVRNSYLLYCK